MLPCRTDMGPSDLGQKCNLTGHTAPKGPLESWTWGQTTVFLQKMHEERERHKQSQLRDL